MHCKICGLLLGLLGTILSACGDKPAQVTLPEEIEGTAQLEPGGSGRQQQTVRPGTNMELQEIGSLRLFGIYNVNFETCGIKDRRLAVSMIARRAALRALRVAQTTLPELHEDDLAFWSRFHLCREYPGFCEKDDAVYDMRCVDPVTKEVRCIIWLNVRSGASLLWIGPQSKPVVVPPPSADDEQTLRMRPIEVVGAKIPTPADVTPAVLASHPYYTSNDFLKDYKGGTSWVGALKTLRHDLAAFGKKGDRVWEVVHHETLLWVHTRTGKLYYLTEPWTCDGPELLERPFTRENTTVAIRKVQNATYEEANVVEGFAFHSLWKDHGEMISGLSGIRARRVMKLGFDIPDFAKRGDRIWECHLCDNFRVRRVIWVNPSAGTTFYLTDTFEQIAD